MLFIHVVKSAVAKFDGISGGIGRDTVVVMYRGEN